MGANRDVMDELRSTVRAFLGLADTTPAVTLSVEAEVREEHYTRKLVSYVSDGERVQAFLFEPLGERRDAAVVALHQHNSQWRLGKSEIAGLAGDPLHAFGPALAGAGICVLAPDAIGFESRCGFAPAGPVELAPAPNAERGSTQGEWLQYYNLAMHRLVRGDLLMRTVLTDAANAVSALAALTGVTRIGAVGHSYGGNIALFAAALDTRIDFTVSSGALCSYRYKSRNGVGLEMALVIPGFAERFDFDDLMRCIAPRSLFVVSSDDDRFAADAEDLVARALPTFEQLGVSQRLQHLRVPGPHPLDVQRFDAIVGWLVSQS